MLALFWALLAMLALVGACVRNPRNAPTYLRHAAGLWIALTLVTLLPLSTTAQEGTMTHPTAADDSRNARLLDSVHKAEDAVGRDHFTDTVKGALTEGMALRTDGEYPPVGHGYPTED